METHSLYINGQWFSGGEPLAVVNPATGKTFAKVATVERARVERAIKDAHQAFKEWSGLPAMARADYLLRIAEELHSNADHIARVITMENGKPLPQSRGEVNVSIDHFRWFAEEARRAYGRIVPHQADGKRHWVLKSPIGVVGAIAPWNFPLVLACRKVAPALAAGCPVILKPASATPLSAIELAKCVEAAGLPPGVFQVVAGKSSDIGAEMLENPLCRKITFTGSTAVGRQLIEGAGATVTRLSLELGGNAPLIVFADADLDQAVEGALITKYRNNAQSCIAANRIYVERPVYDEFLKRFVERTQAMKVGDGLEDGVEIGALIDENAFDTAIRFIEDAKAKGARVLCGGERQEGATAPFLKPTVLADVPENALCLQEEIFAPVAPVCAFDTEDDVIGKANATEYGLAAYVFTNNLKRGIRLAEALEAGTVGLNDAVPSTSNCPFGGFKQSGWGRELGEEGLEAFLETKHVSIGGL
ncbi:MAG: NAD-dependent succinate-semialdehyde dehydrogenase [Kiritimatiellales bacterium]|nr:NAD-dependent succinate-semialdehyde dehydrogenase [Kiritimatiellales bacterium]